MISTSPGMLHTSPVGRARRGGVWLIGLLCLISGCAQLPGTAILPAEQKQQILSGEVLLGAAARDIELPNQPFLSINAEMRAFLDHSVSRDSGRATRIDALIYALRHPGMLDFEYSAAETLTAAQAFEKRTGNCLSFTALLVAMGREVGLKVRFNEVDVPPTWGMQGEQTYVLYRHINANVVRGPNDQVVVDVTPEVYEPEYRQRVVSDRYAEAQYYNNLAADYMGENDTYEAFRHFKKALTLAPDAGFLWSNLGTLYLRHGHQREAEAAFLYALHQDEGNLAAISSLERFYVNRDMPAKAELYRRRAQEVRDRNPYYRYHLAEQAYRDKDYAAAVSHARAAVSGSQQDHRFHFLLGMSYLQLGERVKGEEALQRALDHANAETTKSAYQLKWNQVLAEL
ncbi:hypothetical protein FKG94_26690 [Exilibacterium tricleocarpae]|uniref:Transglutaminase-like domain-containing protein n=1 Tax=Exilibacterium tricleocarpae TaxID=2591008 RepID=A0A545SPR8_9GAMM|nr:transglutaminase domain-containing protein [Exilibacterium tricleocarpae]TQV66944.1 hypothetical protein FKG94_26690 [Exilibacterium tricleocarpae]